MDVRDGAIIATDPLPAERSGDVEPSVTIVSGRPVGYLHLGPSQARSGVVYLHGFPGSCLEALLVAPQLEGTGLGLLALDRPGYGATAGFLSDGEDLHLCARLVSALVDRVGWQRYVWLAVSGAGTCTVAALHHPDSRLAGCLMLSVFPPTFTTTSRRDPALLRIHERLRAWSPGLLRLEARLVASYFGRRPERLRRRLARLLPLPDRRALGDPPLATLLERSWARALRKGRGSGLVIDLAHFLQPLDPPPRPSFPCLSVHGGRDHVVPPMFQDYLHDALPWLNANRWPVEGHFSWVSTRARELAPIMQGWLQSS